MIKIYIVNININGGNIVENNMAIEYPMFCYQCEQTAGGKGCTKMGVCGKTPEVAALQDLLIYQIKGISCYAKELVEKGENVDKDIVSFIEDTLFTTLTNVNFDADVHVEMLKKSQKIKEALRSKVGSIKNNTDHATYNLSDTKAEMLNVNGVGENKYERYGKEFLKCIKEHENQEDTHG